METKPGRHSKKRAVSEFKSHYVVWKHFGKSFQNDPPAQFKSHYVVWKQFFGGNRKKIRFKSHYVVWKQMGVVELHLNDKSLNRTMQYGNFQLRFLRYLIPQSLNRTMQYGNMMYHQRKEKQIFCLNRTMQYGN